MNLYRRVSQRDEAVHHDTSFDAIGQTDDSSYDQAATLTPSSNRSSRHPRKLRRRAPAHRFGGKGWRIGLLVGLYTSLAVLISNAALLMLGTTRNGGIVDGIGTLVQGDSTYVSRLSSILHIFINVMSTVLLTSSNYAMQVLCAPTRHEIDRAHASGQWEEIGLVSLRNLKRIAKGRTALWWLLAISSAPLHLFYNSALFSVVSGQDYNISVLKSTQGFAANDTSWKSMTNAEWIKVYSDNYISGYGDLLLIVHDAASMLVMKANWTFALKAIGNDTCASSSSPASSGTTFEYPFYLSFTHMAVTPQISEPRRYVYGVADLDRYGFNAAFWPNVTPVDVGQQGYNESVDERSSKQVRLCNDDGWLAEPPRALRVDHARAKVRSYGNKVQIALPFLIVVITMNTIKVIGIYMAIRTCSAGHVITVGDAVASFLETPDPGTRDKCLRTQPWLLDHKVDAQPKAWKVKRRPIASTIGGNREVDSGQYWLVISADDTDVQSVSVRVGDCIGLGNSIEINNSFDSDRLRHERHARQCLAG